MWAYRDATEGRVVALDSTKTCCVSFRATLERASGRPLRCRKALSVWLSGKPMVTGTLRLPDFSAVERVLASLREAGIAIEDMRLSPPDLERTFYA